MNTTNPELTAAWPSKELSEAERARMVVACEKDYCNGPSIYQATYRALYNACAQNKPVTVRFSPVSEHWASVDVLIDGAWLLLTKRNMSRATAAFLFGISRHA